MDAGALPSLGRLGGPPDRGTDHRHSGQPPSPRAGLQNLSGVLRLFRDIEPARAEAVSARAIEIGGLTYKSIASILANRLTAKSTTETEPAAIIDHVNLRDPGYFH